MLEYCDGVAEERGLIAWGLVPSTNKLILLSKAKHGPADYSNVSGALCCYRSKAVKFKTDSVLEDMQKKFVKTDGTDEERDSEGAFRPFLI